MNYYYDTFSTPTGDFTLAVTENDAVAATVFGDARGLRKRLTSGSFTRDPIRTREGRNQVLAYFSGQRRSFDLPLEAHGTPFQEQVWTALRRIPFGETRSYGQLAAEIGNAQASRAVGRANGANPICLLVPCHRVIGADGSLTGFAFGEEIKRQLLELEKIPGS